MRLDDIIYYDSIEVIYYTNDFKKPKAFNMLVDGYDWNDNNKITYRTLIQHIMNQEKVAIDNMLIIAERGLEGVVLRWNNHEGLYQVGTTKGYA